VAACLLPFIAPSPSRAAGTTRTAPYDFGVQCLTQDAGGAVGPVGTPLPVDCVAVPDADAQFGRLSTGQNKVSGGGSLVVTGSQVTGAVGRAVVGKKWAATGLNINSGAGGRLRVTVRTHGLTGGGYLCLALGFGGGSPAMVTDCSASPTATVTAAPGIEFRAQLTLHDGPPAVSPVPGPCPPTAVTCTGSAAVSRSGSSVTVDSISYEFV
jgi:hypothetical protein